MHDGKGLGLQFGQALKDPPCVVRIRHIIRKRASFRFQQSIVTSFQNVVPGSGFLVTPLMEQVGTEMRPLRFL